MVQTTQKKPIAIPAEIKQIQGIQATNATSVKKFEKLSMVANNCTMCELCQNRTHAVFGSGNPKAKLMLIGEGPGVNEDRKGLPFVGSAGRQLDRILELVALNRETDLYITNMVKCRNLKPPTLKQMHACSPYLESQLEEIQPKIIVLLGSAPLKGLIGTNAKITEHHGQWLKLPDTEIKTMAVFHPAYLIYKRALDDTADLWKDWLEDWQKIKTAFKAME